MTANGQIVSAMAILFLMFGYLGVPVAFALIAGVVIGTLFTPVSLPSIITQLVQRHRHRGLDGGAVLPAGRRIDDLGQCGRPRREFIASPGRPYARRPCPSR